jgi:hypothetical protein
MDIFLSLCIFFLCEPRNELPLSLPFSVSKKGEARPPLRQYMMDGDFFIGAALGTTLAKLALRYMTLTPDSKKQNRFCSEAMLIMTSVLHLGKSGKWLQFASDWKRLGEVFALLAD